MKRLTALAIGGALLLSGCAGKVVTKTGHEAAQLYNVVLVMATVVFVAVEAAIIWQIVKYRRRRHAERTGLPPQIHGNTAIEVLWTALPSIVIAILFVLSIVVYTKVNAEPANPALTIRVTGFQWQWRFDYLKDNKPVVTENAKNQEQGPTLYLPTGRLIHFELVSGDGTNDVIHSFFIPAFFFKRDVVPGRTNTFDETLESGTEGKYVGECAEFCGEFHNAMTFTLQVMSPSDFDSWFANAEKQQAKGPTCSPSGTSLNIAAKGIKFDTSCLAAPANQAFSVTFNNQDAGVPHNFEIYTKQGGTRLGGATGPTDFFPGVATKTYQVGALKAGTYYFQCDVHPTAMFGTFIVK
jgi:cytochrome c oxidase subunit II